MGLRTCNRSSAVRSWCASDSTAKLDGIEPLRSHGLGSQAFGSTSSPLASMPMTVVSDALSHAGRDGSRPSQAW